MTRERYHFLDGLRGVAMLLGLVLHAAISFVGVEAWPATDVKSRPELFSPIMDAIHGFRMPLFFLVSGFFTTMMFRKRGLRGLVKQRLLRIGVPLVVGTIIVAPLMAILGGWGNEVKKERRALIETREVESSDAAGVWELVLKNDPDGLRDLLEGGGDPGETDEKGTPAITLAAMLGRSELVEVLVDDGADVDQRSGDGGTPLMSAAFFGRAETVQVLVDRGADIEAKNHNGNDAMGSATMDFSIVEMVGEALAIPVDEEMKEGRVECARILGEAGAEETDHSMDWYWMGVFMPVFHHLWFLYYLLWMLLFFVPVAWVARKWGRKLPDWMVETPWCLVWIVPLTFWAQTKMSGSFGPGTATGIFPWGAKLGYYAIFFFFGALCFGRGIWEKKAGRIWWLWLAAGIPFLVVGPAEAKGGDVMTGHFCAVAYCWCMIVAMMGFFRAYLNRGRKWVRYLSDASYWLYLAHMPLMIVVQILISGWDFPVIAKFAIVLFVPTLVLLVIYDLVIRYTWIGAVLNGRKSRIQPPPLPEEKRGV